MKKIADKSRADYFRERRKEKGQFYAEIDKHRLEKLTKILEAQGKTKTDWLNEKIDEELKR